MSKIVVVRYALLLYLVISVNADNCRIGFMDYPAREVIEPLYLIDLSIFNTSHGLAATYFPNTQYDIIIRPKSSALSFKEFHFKMENANSSRSIGALELRDRELTTFDTQDYCINRVINLATPNKPSVTIGWQSPPTKSGCIQMVAYVKETELRYHNANLTVCEDPRIELDDPGQIVKNCSVCERAKYEMTFKGVWSKYTHPKNFPVRDWLAGFPTVIGATHHHDYKIYEVYKNASEAMKIFIETGYSLDLELELKNQSYRDQYVQDNVTTIIKFRGTNFKNKTLARTQLQVDRRNHVVSLVARINPSPDWFIAVSSLELCMGNDWKKSKTLNLYAFDVGSRTGLYFEQQNNGYTEDVINHLNMSWPVPSKDSAWPLPFYDPTNNTHEFRPMAVVEFTLIRKFGNTCNETRNEDQMEKYCFTAWANVDGTCSTTCGDGTTKQKRDYQKDRNNSTCPGKLERAVACHNNIECPFVANKENCQLTEWSGWTACNKSCGQETIGRTRNFMESNYLHECEAEIHEPLHEWKDCGHPPCPGLEVKCSDEKTLYSDWGPWGECSVTVGKGMRYRQRHILDGPVTNKEKPFDAGYVGCTYEKEVCDGVDPRTVTEAPIVYHNDPDRQFIKTTESPDTIPAKCLEEYDEGEACPGQEDESSYRWRFNQDYQNCEIFQYRGCEGNENMFEDKERCMKECHIENTDCVMEWSEWTKCKGCKGEMTRERVVKYEPHGNGLPCPKSGNWESLPCAESDACKKSGYY